MAARVRTYACEDCGGTVTRKRNGGEPLICLECGIARVAQNAYRRSTAAIARRAVLARQRSAQEVT